MKKWTLGSGRAAKIKIRQPVCPGSGRPRPIGWTHKCLSQALTPTRFGEGLCFPPASEQMFEASHPQSPLSHPQGFVCHFLFASFLKNGNWAVSFWSQTAQRSVFPSYLHPVLFLLIEVKLFCFSDSRKPEKLTPSRSSPHTFFQVRAIFLN